MADDKVKKDLEKRLTFPGEETPEVTAANTINSPTVNADDKLTGGKVELDTAGLIGRTSDAVLTGSPAAEYGTTGRFALDGMIEASERIAREKYRANHEKKEK